LSAVACVVTVLFEATAQFGAVKVAPPHSVTPPETPLEQVAGLLLNAMMQAGALASISA
jgi:hypothetical protein